MEPLVGAAHAAWTGQAQRALTAVAEEVLKRAQADAPRDSGHLVGEGHLQAHLGAISFGAGGTMSIEIIFDGPYARKQHEHLEYHHPHGGKAKFLEHNLQNARLLEALAAAEQQVIR